MLSMPMALCSKRHGHEIKKIFGIMKKYLIQHFARLILRHISYGYSNDQR